jgi:hypothetical protein
LKGGAFVCVSPA